MSPISARKLARQTRLARLRAALGQGALRSAQRILTSLHPSETAQLLESLPPAQRDVVWELVEPEIEGEVLVELSDAVREDLISEMEPAELVAAAEGMQVDDLA